MSALLLTAGVALAAPVSAGIGIGLELLPTMGEVASEAIAVRSTVQWHLGPVELGPMVQATAHNADPYEFQDPADPTIAGDFFIVGLGPGLSMPALVETRVLRLGVHLDVLGERLRVPMDEDYYQEEVIDRAWEGQTPRVGLSEWMVRAGGGVDLAFALAPRRPSPELFLAGDVAVRTKLGLAVMPMLGLRVGAGG